MNDRRTRNIEVFQDTERYCKTNEKLMAAIASSNEQQYIVGEGEDVKSESEQRFSEDWSTETVTFTYHEISVSPEEYQELADALAAYSQGRKAQLPKW